MKDLTKEDLNKQIYQVADDRNLEVVEKMVDKIIKGLLANKEKYKDYYCPCQVINKGTQCPCKTLDKQIEDDGRCHCNLYRKKAVI